MKSCLIRCNACGITIFEEELEFFTEDGYEYKGCPDCKTDGCLIDVKPDTYEFVHKNDIQIGDAILRDKAFRTVDKKYIHEDNFMGRTIYGDSYKLGRKRVIRLKQINR